MKIALGFLKTLYLLGIETEDKKSVYMLSIIPSASMNTDEMMDMAEEWFMDI